LEVQISNFWKFLKNILKALGGPCVHHFEKLKDVGKERKRHKNVDILPLGTEGKKSSFWKLKKNTMKVLGSIVRAICTPFEDIERQWRETFAIP
jgi:hypothetical protein